MKETLDTIKQDLKKLEKKSLIFKNFKRESIPESTYICTNCGKPTNVIFSFDSEDHTALLKKAGINLSFDVLEMHYCYNCRPWDSLPSKDGQWKIITDISDPDYSGHKDHFTYSLEDSPSLPDWEGIDQWESELSDLMCEIDDNLPWELYDKICCEIAGTQDTNTCIGGYPSWLQSDATPTCSICDEKMSLVAQLDYDIICIGDMSCMYLFQCEEHKDEKFFVIQSC